jgi:hypothetical protein
VDYKIIKQDKYIEFWARYDDKDWHKIGDRIEIKLNEGGNYDVAISHVRIGDNTTGTAVDVKADDFMWKRIN